MGWAAHVAIKALDTSPRLGVRQAANTSLVLWYAQFALNMAWTPLFFGAKLVSIYASFLGSSTLNSEPC
jgi:benzodiazapine receptor